MSSTNRPVSEYEPVTPSPRAARRPESDGVGDDDAGGMWSQTLAGAEGAPGGGDESSADEKGAEGRSFESPAQARPSHPSSTRGAARRVKAARENLDGGTWLRRRGHALSYAGLFVFTCFVFFRPYELSASLSFLSTTAFYIAILTLVVYVPSQLAVEGGLTVRPREVNLVLLLVLAALLSMPLALNRGEAWDEFTKYIKVVVMFVVLVNVVRTERRLRWLILLVLAASCVMSVGALGDYRAGRLAVQGIRIAGIVGGMFGNPNDLALHLATMVPLALALGLSTRGVLKKLVYGACALLMAAAIVVTFSRGGFLGLACGAFVLAWKFGRRSRGAVVLVAVAAVGLFLALAPGEYAGRLASIVDNARDAVGSASARQEILIRSIIIAIKNPVFGVGMGNFHIVSIHEQVTHNAYTEVASELGLAAAVCYVLFLLTPLKRLRRIERETLEASRGRTRFYALAVGLQASIAAYMVSSFFASVAYLWYIYYLVGYAFCLHCLYEAGRAEAAEKAARRDATHAAPDDEGLPPRVHSEAGGEAARGDWGAELPRV